MSWETWTCWCGVWTLYLVVVGRLLLSGYYVLKNPTLIIIRRVNDMSRVHKMWWWTVFNIWQSTMAPWKKTPKRWWPWFNIWQSTMAPLHPTGLIYYVDRWCQILHRCSHSAVSFWCLSGVFIVKSRSVSTSTSSVIRHKSYLITYVVFINKCLLLVIIILPFYPFLRLRIQGYQQAQACLLIRTTVSYHTRLPNQYLWSVQLYANNMTTGDEELKTIEASTPLQKQSSGGSSGTEFEPPLACVRRMLKNTLPANTNVGKDACAAFSRACGIFIVYLTACANDFARESKRQTITANDILAAVKVRYSTLNTDHGLSRLFILMYFLLTILFSVR